LHIFTPSVASGDSSLKEGASPALTPRRALPPSPREGDHRRWWRELSCISSLPQSPPATAPSKREPLLRSPRGGRCLPLRGRGTTEGGGGSYHAHLHSLSRLRRQFPQRGSLSYAVGFSLYGYFTFVVTFLDRTPKYPAWPTGSTTNVSMRRSPSKRTVTLSTLPSELTVISKGLNCP